MKLCKEQKGNAPVVSIETVLAGLFAFFRA